MNFPDYSEYLNLPGKLETEEKAWLASEYIHDKQAEVVNEVIKKYKIKTVLEIGCGTGNLAMRLNSRYYLGVDSNEKEIEIARTKAPSRDFQVANIRNMEGHLYGANLVCCFSVLKHFALDEWQTIFNKISSLGKYFIFDMQIADETKDDGIDFHHVWFTMDEMKERIDKAGLTLLKVYEDNVAPFFVCKRKG